MNGAKRGVGVMGGAATAPDAAPFNFPLTLACHTMLTRMGIDADRLFYAEMIQAETRIHCVGIEVRPAGKRGSKVPLADAHVLRLAMDEIDLVKLRGTSWADALAKDAMQWNATGQAAREAFLEASPVRSRAVEISALLAAKGLL